jgi:hypothetical protein
MFTPDELQQLPEAISAPRLATYLQVCANDPEAALNLYHWNAEISAAFIVPLHICEVSVRNGVVEAIEAVHGHNWPWSNGFLRSLPRPRDPHHYDPAADLRRVAARLPTTGKIVAELHFAFWEKIFTRGQDQRLWLPHFRQVLPGAPITMAIPLARAHTFQALSNIRQFRNRIAHHEPIFSRALADDYARLREMVEWRRPAVAGWLDKIERVSGLIAAKP